MSNGVTSFPKLSASRVYLPRLSLFAFQQSSTASTRSPPCSASTETSDSSVFSVLARRFLPTCETTPLKCLILETAFALLLTLRARKPPLRLSESSKRVSGEQSSDKQLANHFLAKLEWDWPFWDREWEELFTDKIDLLLRASSDLTMVLQFLTINLSFLALGMISCLICNFYTVFSQDSGHGDNFSEISDDNSGKLSPGFATEKVNKGMHLKCPRFLKCPRVFPNTWTFSDQQKCSRNAIVFVANKHFRFFLWFYSSYIFVLFDL